jgi:hypothetical protein
MWPVEEGSCEVQHWEVWDNPQCLNSSHVSIVCSVCTNLLWSGWQQV